MMDADEGQHLTMRRADTSDVTALARMNKALFMDADSPNPMPLTALEARISGWVESHEWEVIVFVHRAGIAGYAVYQVMPDAYDANASFVTLRQFFIERDLRSHGIGTAAFHLLRTRCFPAHAKVAISVLPHNAPAMRFWSRLGFAVQSITLMRTSTE